MRTFPGLSPCAARVVLAGTLLLTGCATQPPLLSQTATAEISDRLRAERAARPAPVQAPAASIAQRPQVEPTPEPPAARRTDSLRPGPPAPAPQEGGEPVRVNIENERLPTLIQVIYGSILGRNFTIDPAIAARQDLVTLRASQPQTPAQLDDIARRMLKTYGVAVIDLGGGLLRFVPDTAQTGYLPELRRGRALPETPLPMRPIFHFVEMSAVRNTDVSLWLKNMFGNKLTLFDDPSRNAILLTGAPDDVRAALQAIDVLDQPALRGRHGIRLNPTYISVEELSKRLGDLLAAQGYVAVQTATTAAPVVFVPVPTINALFAFATDEKLTNYLAQWTRELDTASASGATGAFFSYAVQNTDAQALAKVLQEVLQGTPAAATAPGAAAAQSAAGARRVVVNPATNTLIISAQGLDRGQVLGLLRDLDRPTRGAVIEVTVAEVQLKDSFSLGVEFGFTSPRSDGSVTSGGTIGNLISGDSGFRVTNVNSVGQLRAAINALATDNKARILSSPTVLARNGETATIQVGEEVPIVTSQQTTGTAATPGGVLTPGVLQTIQYRNTGVILKVRPTIFSDDRVDLDVAQEVSSAGSTTTGVSISPTFSTRKVETKLSLREGSTVMLAGLISSQSTSGEAGVPWLKDIPLVGQLFKQDTRNGNSTELIVLITPYVVSDDADAKAITDAFRKRLGDWAAPPAAAALRPAAKPDGTPPAPLATPAPAQ